MRRVQLQLACCQSKLCVGFKATTTRGYYQADPTSLRIVPAEIAAELAARHIRITHLPTDLEGTLEEYVTESRTPVREARELALRLTDELKSLSRSDARGGSSAVRPTLDRLGIANAAAKADKSIQSELVSRLLTSSPNSTSDTHLATGIADLGGGSAKPERKNTRLSPRMSRRALSEAASALEQEGIHTLDEASINATLGLAPPLKAQQETAEYNLSKLVPHYDKRNVLAYALSRLVPGYAAALRCLREVSFALPDWKPRMVLDYKAGAGAALWAAQEVWPNTMRVVLAVEASLPMSSLGARLEAVRRFAQPSVPRVSWARSLPLLEKGSTQKRKYDLVMANYAMSEVASAEERQRLVRALWGRTAPGGLLLLLEPGTPIGFANIRDARELILGLENRKRGRLQNALDLHGSVADNNSTAKLGSVGAHVVAPCAHDATCPMQGRTMWCHFGVRLLRPDFMRKAKPLGARGEPAKDIQDEKFSYVVLRRGPRKQADEVAVSPRWADDPSQEMHSSNVKAKSSPLPPNDDLNISIPARVVRNQILLDRMAAYSSSGHQSGSAQEQQILADMQTLQQDQHDLEHGEDGEEEGEEEAGVQIFAAADQTLRQSQPAHSLLFSSRISGNGGAATGRTHSPSGRLLGAPLTDTSPTLPATANSDRPLRTLGSPSQMQASVLETEQHHSIQFIQNASTMGGHTAHTLTSMSGPNAQTDHAHKPPRSALAFLNALTSSLGGSDISADLTHQHLHNQEHKEPLAATHLAEQQLVVLQPQQGMQLEASSSPPAFFLQQQQQQQQQQPRLITQHFTAKYPGYGPGLVDRLMALEAKGVDWAGSGDRGGGLSAAGVTAPILAAMARAGQEGSQLGNTHARQLAGVQEGPFFTQKSSRSTFEGEQFPSIPMLTHRERSAEDALNGVAAAAAAAAGLAAQSWQEVGGNTQVIAQQSMEDEHLIPPLSMNAKEEHAAVLAKLKASIFGVTSSGSERVRSQDALQQTQQRSPSDADRSAGNRRPGQSEGSEDSEAFQNDGDEFEGSLGEELHPSLGSAAHWAFRDPDRHSLTAAASSRWPRIYRPPRQRGQHVILDLCVASQYEQDGVIVEGAHLERHNITKADGKGWMGKPSYQLACHVKWGDKWPGWYCNTRKKVDVEDPDLHKAVGQLRRRQEGEAGGTSQSSRHSSSAQRRVNEGFREDFASAAEDVSDDEAGGFGHEQQHGAKNSQRQSMT